MFFNWIFILSSDIELKQWGPLAETFRQGCQNCNPSFKKTSPMKFVFCHCSPMKCWYWAKKSHFFGVKILAGFSKLHPTCPEEPWLGENTLSWNCFCYPWTFRYNILACWWKLLAIVAKVQFTWQEVEIDVNRFLVFFSLINCSYWAKKFWSSWLNVAAGFLKLHPTCPEEQWIEEDFFKLILNTIFGYWGKTRGLFGGNFSAGLSKLQSKFQEDESLEIRFLSLFSQELLILSKKLSTFLCKNFSRVFEAASYVSGGAMTWGKHFVLELFLLSLDIQITNFSLLVETSRHCCKSAVYASRSWDWRKPFFC